MEEVNLCEAISLRLPVAGGKHWTGLLDIRWPVLSRFYFCVVSLPEISVRRYTVYIDISRTSTILKFYLKAFSRENSACVPYPCSTVTHLHFSELTLVFPSTFLCQYINVSSTAVGEVAALGVVGHASQWAWLHFWGGENTHHVQISQCLLQLIPQSLCPWW